jgi:hypothetical protein
MTARILAVLPGVVAVSVGAVLANGLGASIVAALTLPVLIALGLHPQWSAGPTLVAGALIIELAVADHQSWWRTLVMALLLAMVLVTGEAAQTSARMHIFLAHRRGMSAALLGAIVVTATSTAPTDDADVAALLTGVAVAAALLALTLATGLRNRRSRNGARPQ